MDAPAIIVMLVAIIILWGGLAISATALFVRGRREASEAQAEAAARARANFRKATAQEGATSKAE